MKKVNILLLMLMVALGGFAQHCIDSINYVIPYPGSTPGLSPAPDALACHQSGDTYYDTLYLHNYTAVSGLSLNYLKIDSIENLPAGLCWSTNKANNTFAGGEDGTILIKGTSAALPGQYKLRIIVDANAGPNGVVNLAAINADALGLKYYLKVACSNGTCLPVGGDTISAFVPYNANCTMGTAPLTASISTTTPTTFCQGSSVTLAANSGYGYTYLWSNGNTAPSIVVSTAGTYTVTVYNATDSAVSSPVTVTVVTTCQNSGIQGFSPSSDQLPCITRGQAVNDTIYYINYTTLNGLTVASLKFDSIANLPSGLTWSTNKPNNTWLGGDSGFIVIQGTTLDSSGQYKMRITIDMITGANVGVFTNVSAEPLLGMRYYLRVACTNGGCLPIDSIQGQYYPNIPYTSGCAITTMPPTASISAGGATNFCHGGTVILSANSGPAYTYLWSNGASTQNITVDTTGNYYVTVTDAAGSAVAGPVAVTVNSCQNSGIPGFSPPSDQLSCMGIAQFVVDTIHFTNYSTVSGLTVNSLKIDSINNLPQGLTWSTNRANNTFLGGDSGDVYISGVVNDSSGQYKLRFVIDLNAGPNGVVNIPNADLETLAHLRYYLRVSCSGNQCPAIVDDSIHAFLPYSSGCTPIQPTAVVVASGSTTVCAGGTVVLTANPGYSGYTYVWSNGATTQSIAVSASGFYTVTAFYMGQAYSASSPYITVMPPVQAYFTIQPDPNTPHVWYAVNQCTGNQLSYVWNWGDSSISTGATPSHTYSSAGNYNICVTVTDSLGCSNYYCDSNAYVFKTDDQMIKLSVVQYATGVNDIASHSPEVKYYANALHFSEAIVAPVDVTLYDLSGRAVMTQDRYTGSVIDVNAGIASGVYILHSQNNSFNSSQKIMIIR